MKQLRFRHTTGYMPACFSDVASVRLQSDRNQRDSGQFCTGNRPGNTGIRKKEHLPYPAGRIGKAFFDTADHTVPYLRRNRSEGNTCKF